MNDEDEAASDDAGKLRRERIVARLYAALDQKMREIKTSIERAAHGDFEDMSAAGCERDARTLTTFAKLYEKICELEGVPDNESYDAELKQREQEIDADRFRLQIAERLKGMLEEEED